MRKLKVVLIKLFANPSKARVNKAIRDYNQRAIKTNWAWQGASK